jgi:hypothetical protein
LIPGLTLSNLRSLSSIFRPQADSTSGVVTTLSAQHKRSLRFKVKPSYRLLYTSCFQVSPASPCRNAQPKCRNKPHQLRNCERGLSPVLAQVFTPSIALVRFLSSQLAALRERYCRGCEAHGTGSMSPCRDFRRRALMAQVCVRGDHTQSVGHATHWCNDINSFSAHSSSASFTTSTIV